MSKSVENGTIKLLSPSMINKFDASAPFGCERRWWYRYVKGLDEPQIGNQYLGEKVHALVEAFLAKRELGMEIPAEDEALGIYLSGQRMVEEVAKRTILGVETPLPEFTLDGTRVQGYVDVVTSDGIIDWKTSSDIRRYGKTESELATDTQMTIYALAVHPNRSTVKLAHGQFQTKGTKRANFVEVEVTDKHLASHRDNVIIPLVQKMKSAASESDVRKLPRNEKSCFNCHFKSHCPTAEGETVMSFFSKMSQPQPQAVLPPDAPKSEPAKAADPVEGFSPVPPPRKMKIEDVPSEKISVSDTHDGKTTTLEGTVKGGVLTIEKETMKSMSVAEFAKTAEAPAPEASKRGRGRPPGSKNKAKEEVIAYDPSKTVSAAQGPVIKSVTITKGYTVNVGAFNSVRFDVSMTAEGADCYDALKAEVDAALEAEVVKYQAEVDQKNKVFAPAKDVVLK